MNKYDEIKKIIEEAEDGVDFADFGNGVSEEWISKAEERLGFELPETYKWWLKNYGGGEIYGEEIFSIYEEDFDTVVKKKKKQDIEEVVSEPVETSSKTLEEVIDEVFSNTTSSDVIQNIDADNEDANRFYYSQLDLNNSSVNKNAQ